MNVDFEKILSDSSRLTINTAMNAVAANLRYFKAVLHLAIQERILLNLQTVL